MTLDQILAVTLLGGALALFVWGRFRYDLVAFSALILAVLIGLVPAREAFLGFGHPAVITVAAVLIISQGLSNSGAVEWLAGRLIPDTKNDLAFIAVFCAVAATLSGFMNNVGALALLMPVAIQAAARSGRSPALILMPLSFASILGGLTTLIGTPPNIIIASYRARERGEPFAMFDFAPVGALTAIAGVLFVAAIGWRLIPKDRLKRKKNQEIFDIEGYVAEVKVPKDSEWIGQTLREVEAAIDAHGAAVLGLIRDNEKIRLDRRRKIERNDLLVIEANPESMGSIAEDLHVDLVSGGKPIDDLTSDQVSLVEAVVTADSMLNGKTPNDIQFRRRFRLSLLAVSRQGKPSRTRLRDFRFESGDVLLLHGDTDNFPGTLARMGALPLAERDMKISPPSRAGLAAGLFGLAILATAIGLTSAPVAFSAAIVAYLLTRILNLQEAYEAIDWPIIVLLAALIPIGGALEATGATKLFAQAIVDVSGAFGPVAILILVMVATMTLSDIINNAATAVVMAPIAAGIAKQLNANPDAFLMAVAIGASCAFLTPIGHQNNTLVMGPGGYRFGDYWRVGLPLEILIVALATPLLLLFFPL